MLLYTSPARAGTYSSPGKPVSPERPSVKQIHGLEVLTAIKTYPLDTKSIYALIPFLHAELSNGWLSLRGNCQGGSQGGLLGLILCNRIPSGRIKYGEKNSPSSALIQKPYWIKSFFAGKPTSGLKQQLASGCCFGKESPASTFTPHQFMHLLFLFQAVY